MNLKFIIRKNRIIEGAAPIQMQITIDGERVFISIGQRIEVDLWDQKIYRAIGKTPKIKALNEMLDKLSVVLLKSLMK